MEITKKQFAQYLQNKGFEGIDGNPEISLFEDGILYNPQTEQCISTWPDHIFEEMGKEEITFNLIPISENEVKEKFETDKEGILDMTGDTEEEFLNLPLVMQIESIEFHSSSFDLKQPPMMLTMEDVVEKIENQ